MRQPIYRGFNKEENMWYYGHGWFKSDYTEEYKKEKGIEDTAILHTDYSPVECELSSMGVFTGLYDRGGKEIFIGDVVKLGNYDQSYEVMINDFMQIPVIDNDNGQEELFKVNKNCRVIGTIYDMPDWEF